MCQALYRYRLTTIPPVYRLLQPILQTGNRGSNDLLKIIQQQGVVSGFEPRFSFQYEHAAAQNTFTVGAGESLKIMH